MKNLIILSFLLILFNSCKRETTYDYMIYNVTSNGIVKLKFQTIELQGNASVAMDLQKNMGMSIYTEKSEGKLENKELNNEISVIKKIAILLNDSTTVAINPKSVANWKFQKLNAHHGIYTLYLSDGSLK